jgi:hypothetical protein
MTSRSSSSRSRSPPRQRRVSISPPHRNSRSRSRSHSPIPFGGEKRRRFFTPSPERGGGESFSTFDVPSEFKRSSNFLQRQLLSGSGDFGIKGYHNFVEFTETEKETSEVNAGHVGDCLPFGYTSFMDLCRDFCIKLDLGYSIYMNTGLKNFWEEAFIKINEDSFEVKRGSKDEHLVAKVVYDSIFAISGLGDGNVFTVFYDTNKVIRLMHERYEVAFVVYYGLWKLSENGRKKDIVPMEGSVEWDKYPEEVLSKIFSVAVSGSKDIAVFSLVCQKWYTATQRTNQPMWKNIYELDFNEVAYFKSGTEVDWRRLLQERKRVNRIKNYDVIRCTSPSQRDLKLSVGVSFFDTHVFNCAMFSGKWYFEFVMPEIGIDAIQVGVTTVMARPFYHVGWEYFGVGDDDFSWSYDGVRSQKFHGNTIGNTQNWQEQYKWGPGDVIRVAMNIDEGELRFLYNHNDLGVVYNFPVQHRVTNFDDDERAKEVPILPYFPAITAQQSTYGGEVKQIEIIIQRAKMRYGPPEGFTALGEHMEEKQYVDKICLTHVGEDMKTLVVSKQLTSFVEEFKSKGLIEVPPPIENVNVDAGEYAQRLGGGTTTSTSTTTTDTGYGDYGFDFF